MYYSHPLLPTNLLLKLSFHNRDEEFQVHLAWRVMVILLGPLALQGMTRPMGDSFMTFLQIISQAHTKLSTPEAI